MTTLAGTVMKCYGVRPILSRKLFYFSSATSHHITAPPVPGKACRFFFFFFETGLLVRKCTRLTRSCFSLSVIPVRNALKDFTHTTSRNSPCVGTLSVTMDEVVNASRCLFAKAKVQIGDSKMGVRGLQGSSDFPAFCYVDCCLFIH